MKEVSLGVHNSQDTYTSRRLQEHSATDFIDSDHFTKNFALVSKVDDRVSWNDIPVFYSFLWWNRLDLLVIPVHAFEPMMRERQKMLEVPSEGRIGGRSEQLLFAQTHCTEPAADL